MLIASRRYGSSWGGISFRRHEPQRGNPAGTGIILMASAWLFGMVPLGALAPVVLMPFWKPLRARITQPRLGFVELSGAQEGRDKEFLLTSITIGVVTFLISIAVYLVVIRSPGDLNIGIAGLPAIIIAFMALMTAAITSLKRFILYAGFLVVCGVTVSLLDMEPFWSLLAGGLAIVIGGGIGLSRFISQHQVRSDEKV
jgi:hypothetical protein